METKNTNFVAKTLLEWLEKSKTPILLQADIQEKFGPDLYAEAINRGWIEVNYELGSAMVTSSMNRLNEMRKVAQLEPEQPKPAVVRSYRSLVEAHSEAAQELHRHNLERISENKVEELAGPDPSWRQFVLAQENISTPIPTAPGIGGSGTQSSGGAAPNPEQEPADIGDTVTIAENGQSYQGVVQSKKQDGKFVLSFGSSKPSTARDYESNELKVVKKAEKAKA